MPVNILTFSILITLNQRNVCFTEHHLFALFLYPTSIFRGSLGPVPISYKSSPVDVSRHLQRSGQVSGSQQPFILILRHIIHPLTHSHNAEEARGAALCPM